MASNHRSLAHHLLLSTTLDEIETVSKCINEIIGDEHFLREDDIETIRQSHPFQYHYEASSCSVYPELQQALDNYVDQTYTNGKCYIRQSEGGYAVSILGRLKQNHHQGLKSLTFLSEFVIEKHDSSSFSLIGSMNICVHSFEGNSNIYMKSSNVFPSDVVVVDDERLVENVVNHIRNYEQAQWTTHQVFNESSIIETSFKSLRRRLPITKTKMNWNIEPHRMVQTLQK